MNPFEKKINAIDRNARHVKGEAAVILVFSVSFMRVETAGLPPP